MLNKIVNTFVYKNYKTTMHFQKYITYLYVCVYIYTYHFVI